MPVTYADAECEPLETEWNWENYCPRGGVVLVAGWRESAKGLLTWKLAAAATNGDLLPGETGDPGRIAAGLSPKPPGDVVMISAEDHLNEAKAWRARGAQVRLERVHDMTELDDGAPFELSGLKHDQGNAPELLGFLRRLRVSCMCGFSGADMADLAAHLDRNGTGCEARNPRWVFIDPLKQVALDGSVNRGPTARRLIGRLERIGRLTGVTIYVIHHYVKSGGIGGAQDLVDAPRWVYEIQPDPAAEDCKVIRMHKGNNGSPPDIRYRIVRDGHDTRIEWVAPADEAREERSWRNDELAARRQAKTGAAPARPAAKAITWTALASSGAGPVKLAENIPDDARARVICERSSAGTALAAAGIPFRWRQQPDGTWRGGNERFALAVVPVAVSVAG